ncbi:Flotillin-1 [Nymphon striatum]|nr:Flotillin-1 [Nymphon striatum]
MRRDFLDGDGIFQQDLAPCHTSRKMRTFFEESGLEVLDWPGNSPDINPIENLWAIMKRRLQKEDCSTMTKLISAVIRAWYHDEELAKMCSTLVESMPNRVQMLVKIQGQNEEMLLAACQQFLGKNDTEIMHIALETLEGHQRAIMGTMTVEEIYKDRKKFSKNVFEVASSDLINMGITVVSYTIKDIRDDEGYLKALGMARTAEVKRDARMGESAAKRDAQIKREDICVSSAVTKAQSAQESLRVMVDNLQQFQNELDGNKYKDETLHNSIIGATLDRERSRVEAIAEEERMAARYLNDTEIAGAQRNFEMKKAVYDMEVQTKKAESDMAYELQAAKTKQKIKEEQMQIKVIERTQEIPSPRTRNSANRVICEAEATAESIKMRGEAESFAIQAKAKAEAEQMAKKADAWKEYKNAALIDMVLDILPKVAAEVAAPLANCKKITMVASGDGEIGAARMAAEVMDIMTKVPNVVEQMTGVNLAKICETRHHCFIFARQGSHHKSHIRLETAGSADSFIRASHVLRTRRAHQVTAAALYILQHRAYSHYCLGQTRDAKDLSEFESWCCQRGKDIPQFHYWATMLELELLLLVYVRSLRQGSLMMYIEALTELVPWFYALDHTHYARWIPVHLKDMAELTTKHPDVAKKFKESHFTVQKTQRAFSSIPIDQAHEQNNACIKGDGGAVGLTDNPSALRRWMVAGPEVARVIEEFQDVSQHCRQKKADTRHHDQTPSVQTSFVKDVRSLVDVIEEMGNPFEEESQDVVKLSSAPRDIPDKAMSIIERFVILLYDRTSKCTDIDKARRKLFAKKNNACTAHPPNESSSG